MKKYIKAIGKKQKFPIARFGYFFIAWNLFGLVLYKYYNKNKSEQDDRWKDMSGTQKYLALMGSKDVPVTVVDIHGLTLKDISKKDALTGDILDVPKKDS